MQSEDIFKPHIHLAHAKQLNTAKRVIQQLSTYMEVNEITEEGSGEGLFLNHYRKVLDKSTALEQRETVEKDIRDTAISPFIRQLSYRFIARSGKDRRIWLSELMKHLREGPRGVSYYDRLERLRETYAGHGWRVGYRF
jgi:hypothetical protein